MLKFKLLFKNIEIRHSKHLIRLFLGPLFIGLSAIISSSVFAQEDTTGIVIDIDSSIFNDSNI